MKKIRISAMALALCFSLSVSFLRFPLLNVCALSDSDIVYAAMEIIVSSEGNYGSVNANDNGAPSIGKLQWHGTRALDLLKTVVAADASSALLILGQELYDEIINSSDWSARPLDSSESAAVSALLVTQTAIDAQNELAYADILSYVTNAKALGIDDPSAIVYFCDLNNQHGLGGAKRIAASAAESCGSYSQITCIALHNAALADSAASKYSARREKVYGYAVSLDWDLLQTDIDIGVAYSRPVNAVNSSSPSNDIKWLQSALNILGGYSLDINGSFDGATQKALVEFETVCHLFANGEASVYEIEHYAELLYIKANPKPASFYTVTTNGANLNLRATPSSSGSILAKMPNGSDIKVYSVSGDWAYVDYGGIKGYCSSEWITFKSANSITSLQVKSAPKTVYRFGEAFDFDRLILKATYASGDFEYITQGFDIQGDTDTLGSGCLTFTYQGVSTQIEITVSDEVSSIEICGTPKTEYTFGDAIDTQDMYIKVNYAGGAYEYIYSGFTVSADMNTLGTHSAVVTYCGASAEYTVTVGDKLTEIEVASMPTKTIYYLGIEEFDSAGLVLKCTYASGSVKYVASGYKIFPFFNISGQSPAYILYDGLETKITFYAVVYGDANLNTVTNSYDALYILQASAGLVDMNEYQLYAADLNGDAQINSIDALCLLKQIVYDDKSVLN